MWVRGLKRTERESSTASSASHPMWVRGLKPCVSNLYVKRGAVAPYVGAWIETSSRHYGVHG